MSQQRDVIDPQANQVNSQTDLPERMPAIKDEETEGTRQKYAAEVLCKNELVAEEGDVNGGELAELDHDGTLLEALPKEFVAGVFAGEDATLAVLDWSEEEAVGALELEPTDVVGTLAARDEIVL